MPSAPCETDWRHARRRGATALALLLGAGCARGPVQWGEPHAAPAGSDAGHIAVDSSGRTSLAAPPPRPVTLPRAPMCPGSVRFAWLDQRQVYAAWWAARPDSSAVLYADYSPDGGATWRGVSVVDTLDRSSDGCRRAAPGIAASGEYVHVAYGLRAPEGAGVFFSHSMDRGVLFHAPVIITYADRPGAAAVAASGDTVVVAYEDPNQAPTEIGLAVSHTMGHIFEQHTPVSSGASGGTAPEVALAGSTVAVAWLEGTGGDTGRAVRMVRVGRLR